VQLQLKFPKIELEDISRILAAEELGLTNLNITTYYREKGILVIYEELLSKSSITVEEEILKSSIRIILQGNIDDEYNMYSRALDVYKKLTQ